MVIGEDTFPNAVTVTTCGALIDPTTVEGNVKLVGERRTPCILQVSIIIRGGSIAAILKHLSFIGNLLEFLAYDQQPASATRLLSPIPGYMSLGHVYSAVPTTCCPQR